jgi:hypothetical protein
LDQRIIRGLPERARVVMGKAVSRPSSQPTPILTSGNVFRDMEIGLRVDVKGHLFDHPKKSRSVGTEIDRCSMPEPKYRLRYAYDD